MKFLSCLLVMAALLAAFCYGLSWYLDLPYYCESVSTGKCSYLQQADGTKLDCSQYDPNQKYIHIYTE